MIAFILGVCIPIFCGFALPVLIQTQIEEELSTALAFVAVILGGCGSLIVYLVWLVHAGYVKLV